MKKIQNIVEYLGAEHQNEMISFANLKEEHGSLIALDNLFQEILSTFTAEYHKDLDLLISSLFMSVKNELYISMSQLLKTNVGKAFLSSRIAIDMGFHAYYLTVYPEQIEAYLDEDHELQKQRFHRIKDHMKKNPDKYPLAGELIGAHEMASKYFAHSCFESIQMKLQFLKKEEGGEKLILDYFDNVDQRGLSQFYYGLLLTYYRLLMLFYKCFFKKQFRVIYQEREKIIEQLGKHLLEKYQQYSTSVEKWNETELC